MASSVLTDVKSVSFTNLKNHSVNFNAQITGWQDTRKPRIAMHEYLKRDGGEAEYMGRSPHRVRFNIVYVGPNWRKDLIALQSIIDEYPIGKLVHPLFEITSAACEGIDNAQVDVVNGLDTVTVPISFVESNVTTAEGAGNAAASTPQAHEVNVNLQANALATTAPNYSVAFPVITGLITAAIAYASTAADSSLTSATPDFTLEQQLANVTTSAVAARAAIVADPSFVNHAVDFPTLVQIELLVDSCSQLDDSLKSARPVLSKVVVGSQTTLLAIAQQYYGPDALSRMGEILTNNSGKIHDPNAIPVGTVLYLATATVSPGV